MSVSIRQSIRFLGLAATIILFANPLSTKAQALPEAAILPDGKGAWAVDQLFKTSIGGAYTGGYIRVVILSDGKVFHRKFFDSLQPATPWCQDQFTAEEMRDIRAAMARATPSAWQRSYGEMVSALSPFRRLTITVRAAGGQAVDYTTLVYREPAMPDEVARIVRATDTAGNLAFNNCANSTASNPAPVVDKVENGATIYAVNGQGDLLWYNHSGFQNGEASWANRAQAKPVGHEWGENVKIFKGDPRGGDGVIYTVSKEGYLTWYKHQGYASGSTDWLNGKNVNINFSGRQVFTAGGGIIYLLDAAGDLYWYKHLGYASGEKIWANNGKGLKVSETVNNWQTAQHLFSGGDGVIYLVDANGDLYWQKHLGFQDGTPRWSAQKKIGSGWRNLRQIFCVGEGIIYAVKSDGTFLWQRHEGFASGAAQWAKSGAASAVGNGWQFKFVF
jgi:hypothetical protein